MNTVLFALKSGGIIGERLIDLNISVARGEVSLSIVFESSVIAL